MSGKYPRVNFKALFSLPDRVYPCDCCNGLAVGNITIQYNQMRGDDEIYKACSYHYSLADRDLDGFLGDVYAHEQTLSAGVMS